jgi:hypothetical protein
MKKVNSEFIAQLLFGIAGVALMIIGAILLVAHFFIPSIVLFEAAVYLALGAILYLGVRLYFMFLEAISTATNVLDKMNANRNGRIYPEMNAGMVNTITITDQTTPEEIEELKRKFPMFAESFDNILKSNPVYNKEVDTKELSITQLETALQIAIDNNEFEKAAEIRDEISRRKV